MTVPLSRNYDPCPNVIFANGTEFLPVYCGFFASVPVSHYYCQYLKKYN
jgi:hypothetical protein